MLSCRKQEEILTEGDHRLPIWLSLSYHVDGDSLLFESIRYRNEAGNRYSVTRLQYYLSQFRFRIAGNPDKWYVIDTVFYCDGRRWLRQTFLLGKIPRFRYDQVCFFVGLPPEWNQHGRLPPTIENLQMMWPTPMGGGYHFLKLEGHFLARDTSTTPQGYALHLGTNVALVPICVSVHLVPNAFSRAYGLHLSMNIAEWFRNPHLYDLAEKGYIMGDTLRMQIIAENGRDVFTAEAMPSLPNW